MAHRGSGWPKCRECGALMRDARCTDRYCAQFGRLKHRAGVPAGRAILTAEPEGSSPSPGANGNAATTHTKEDAMT